MTPLEVAFVRSVTGLRPQSSQCGEVWEPSMKYGCKCGHLASFAKPHSNMTSTTQAHLCLGTAVTMQQAVDTDW